MEIGLTEEQEALRAELRQYYAEPAHPRRRGRSWPRAGGSGRPSAASSSRWRADGWLGIGWPTEYGGQGRSAMEQFIFFDESMRCGAPVPDAHHQHRRPDDHAVRHRRAEGVLPAEDPCRRDSLLHRLHRAERRDRPGRARDQGRGRRRRAGDQRHQGVHQPGRRRRLLLAGRAHRSRCREAQGHLDRDRAHGHARRPGGAHAAVG